MLGAKRETLSLAFAVDHPLRFSLGHRQTLTIHWARLTGQRAGQILGAGPSFQLPSPRTRAWQPLGAVCRLPFAGCPKSHINNENCTVAKSLNGKYCSQVAAESSPAAMQSWPYWKERERELARAQRG